MIAAILAAAALHLPAPVRGDFDHDGRSDTAEVVATLGGRFELIIRRGARGHPTAVIATFHAADLPDLYVTKATPGRWKTWCGKGGGSDDQPCPRTYVVLKGETLDFGIQEASESVALWTGKRFEIVRLSD